MNLKNIHLFKALLVMFISVFIDARSFACDQNGKMKTFVFKKDIFGTSSSDYEMAKRFHAPAELEFEFDKDVKVDANKIQISGHLVNKSSQAFEIFVFPVSGSNPFFGEIFMTSEVRPKPHEGPQPPASVPPPPMTIKISAQSKVSFKHQIDLSEIIYQGSPKVEIRWTFNYWNEPKPSGTIAVQLPGR